LRRSDALCDAGDGGDCTYAAGSARSGLLSRLADDE
jgi:hypothetical protein